MNTQAIVQKRWNLCHALRDDGITYHEYVTELTFLLLLKMMKEAGSEEQIPSAISEPKKRTSAGAAKR